MNVIKLTKQPIYNCYGLCKNTIWCQTLFEILSYHALTKCLKDLRCQVLRQGSEGDLVSRDFITTLVRPS